MNFIFIIMSDLAMNDSGFAERGGYQDPSKIELSEVEVVKQEPMNE